MTVPAGYKVTEVGVIPEAWSALTLGEFVSLRRGHDLTGRHRRPGLVPVMGSAGQNGWHDVALAPGPGVIVGRSGASFGQAHFCQDDFWPHNTAMYVTDFHGNDIKFAFYFLRAFDFSRQNSGGAQQSLNRNHIAPLPVAIPPPAEQAAIATALNHVDALITALEQLLAKKRDLKQATMQRLLTGKERLPGFGGEWQRATFGQIFDFLATATNSRADLSEGAGDAFYVHYGDIHTKFQAHLRFDRQLPPTINSKLCRNATPIRNGDWIMADASEDLAGVGKLVEVIGLGDGMLAVSGLHTMLLRERIQTFVPGFKGHLGASPDLHAQLLTYVTGTKVYAVSKSTLKDVVLPVPPLPEQTAIATVLTDIDTNLTALETRLTKTRALKAGMMQELLTGRIRLV